MNNTTRSKLMLIASMTIFGTIGIFRRYLPLPSGMLAMARGVIGAGLLLALTYLRGGKLNTAKIRPRLLLLVLSGALIGFNWILLFEAYRYTTVATATLCYYMAPILVIIASPVLLREKLTLRKGVCVAWALVGMVLVTGVLEPAGDEVTSWMGIALGLGAAALYASVILLNKRLTDVPSADRTVVQLAAAAVVLVPYVFLTEDVAAVAFTPVVIVMLIVVGVVHTGLAYAWYFGSMKALSAQTVALYSYIDPIVAILLSALVLQEGMSALKVIGTVLVLGATICSEIDIHQWIRRKNA